jgi:hypothetical protein
MSVDFSALTGTRTSYKRVACDSPDMGLTCTAEERCGYCDDGFMEVPVYEDGAEPVNMANATARVVLDLLGWACEGEGLYGSIPAEGVPFALQRCMVVLAKEGVRAPYLDEGGELPRTTRVVEGEDGLPTLTAGPRVFMGAMSDERVVRQVTAVRDLLSTCAQRGWGVSWG